MLHPPREVAGSGFPPLSNIPHCCPPQGYGPCLSSIVADHPLRPAIHHCLGEPLPHQQANRPRPPPLAVNLSSTYFHLVGLIGDQLYFYRYPLPKGRLSTCYAPVCHAEAFDLHVLGASLAFILSQGQTLHKSCTFTRNYVSDDHRLYLFILLLDNDLLIVIFGCIILVQDNTILWQYRIILFYTDYIYK